MELLVSVAVLLLLLAMVGMIFSMASEASGKATANNELLANLRSLERQLRKDFTGLDADTFVGFWYELREVPDPSAPEGVLPPPLMTVRTDRIVFFTTGDHASNGYCQDVTVNPAELGVCGDPTGEFIEPLRSPIARVFYGHADLDPNGDGAIDSPADKWMLARRQKLMLENGLTDDPVYVGPSLDFASQLEYDSIDFEVIGNVYYPMYGPALNVTQLTDLQRPGFPVESLLDSNGPMNELIPSDYANGTVNWIARPTIWKSASDLAAIESLRMLCLSNCAEFKVQRWVERYPPTGLKFYPSGELFAPRWWPEDEVDLAIGSGIREYAAASSPEFRADGTFVYSPAPGRYAVTAPESAAAPNPSLTHPDWNYIPQTESPKVIKITVKLYDDRKRLDDGQEYTMVFQLN